MPLDLLNNGAAFGEQRTKINQTVTKVNELDTAVTGLGNEFATVAEAVAAVTANPDLYESVYISERDNHYRIVPSGSGYNNGILHINAGTKQLERVLKEEPFVILATGQSNVQQELAYSWQPSNNVLQWGWPGLGTVGTNILAMSNNDINHTLRCADVISRLIPERLVVIVKIASSGRPIAHWLPGGSTTTLPEWDAFADCKNNIEACLAKLGKTKIDMLHWHQGESDAAGFSGYKQDWRDVQDRFMAESWFGETTPVVINGLTSEALKGDSNYKFQNLNLRDLSMEASWRRIYIPTAEILSDTALWNADRLHPLAIGHDILGQVEANAVISGFATKYTQGFSYDPETGNVRIGSDSYPLTDADLSVDRGSNTNSTTRFRVVNGGTNTNDIAESGVSGANGTYTEITSASGAFANHVQRKWTGSGGIYDFVTSSGSHKKFIGSTEAFSVLSDFSIKAKWGNIFNGLDGGWIPKTYTVSEALAMSRTIVRVVMVTDPLDSISKLAYSDGTNWRWVYDNSVIA